MTVRMPAGWEIRRLDLDPVGPDLASPYSDANECLAHIGAGLGTRSDLNYRRIRRAAGGRLANTRRCRTLLQPLMLISKSTDRIRGYR